MQQHNLSTKELQRKKGIAARKGITKEEAKLLSRKICDRLTGNLAYKKARTVLSYIPFGAEVDVSFINDHVKQEGKVLALPICHDEGRMVAAVPKSSDAWEIGKHGILAPIEEKSLILHPSELDFVIVPCTAFEGSSRKRMGMGAGYYDRYLPQCINAVCIAVAFESQHIRDLCVEPWDFPLNAIVTEANWY